MLGVAPADAIAFEDSPMGVQAAVAAGLIAVASPDRPGVDLAAAGAACRPAIARGRGGRPRLTLADDSRAGGWSLEQTVL